MGDRTADEWLPEGWKVEVRVRKNGRKDKCYFPPSGGDKFYSKVEVLRYLNDGHVQLEEEPKSADQQSSENVVAEKDIPKELPPGWIKEVKVTRKGGRIRRDPFYTDPVSGFVFRSMKDALRYIETGVIGRLALKPKDGGNRNLVLEDDKTCSTAATKKQMVISTESPSPKSNDERSKSPVTVEDKQIFNSLGADESTNAVERASGGMRNESYRLKLSSDKDSGQNEVNIDASERDKHSVESELTKDENKKTRSKSKKKKALDLPRRASKRLAGICLDPTPELEMPGQGHQGASKQPHHLGGNADEASIESHHTITKVPNSTELAANIERGNNGDKEHKGAILEIPGNVDNIADETELPLNLPLGELWQDPCIAFAIKTLTGTSLETSDTPKMSPGSNDAKFRTLNTMEENAEEEDRGNGVDKTRECTVFHITNAEHARELESFEKGDDKQGSTLSLDVWADPCIEFAIKTLTGAIPLDYSLVAQDCQQSSSYQSQERSGSSLPNGDDHYQNDFLCQQLSSPGRPVFYGAALMEPGLTYGSRGNSGGSSGTTRRHQRGEEGSNQHP